MAFAVTCCGERRRLYATSSVAVDSTDFSKALSIVYGIEPYVVLRDIWSSGDREVEEIARWMLDALIDAALRESSGSVAMEKRRCSSQRCAAMFEPHVLAGFKAPAVHSLLL